MKWSIVGLVVLGVIAALSAALLMKIVTGPQRGAGEVSILVAKADLPGNMILDANSIEEKKVPRDKVPEEALSTPQEAIGKIIKEPLAEGQAIQKSMFVTDDRAAVASGLKPGERAVAISLSDFAGLDGVLYIGSVVDVVLTVNSAVTSGGKSQSKTVLENITVLGIERQTIVAKDAEKQTESGDRRGQNARRVTLKVTSQQAAELSLAQNAGTLSLALRNPSDRQAAYKSPISITSLVPGSGSDTPGWLKSLAQAAQANAAASPAKPEAPASTDKSPTLFDSNNHKPAAAAPGWSTTVIRGSAVETVDFPNAGEPPAKVVNGQ